MKSFTYPRIIRAVIFALAASASMLLSTQAKADSLVALQGVDNGPESFYGYIGALDKLNGTFGDDGFLVRIWGDRLLYDFYSGAGKVHAFSWGGSASVGWQWVHAGGAVSGYAGYDTRYTSITPNAPSSIEGNKTGARFEGDVAQALTPLFKFEGIGSYVTSTYDYWTRERVLAPIPFGMRAGVEAIWQGNSAYSAHRLGVVLSDIHICRSVSADVDAGYDRNISFAAGSFVGVHLAESF